MNATVKIDAARVELLLSALRLPGIKLIWAALADTAATAGWPAARLLAPLAQHDMGERCRGRFAPPLSAAPVRPGPARRRRHGGAGGGARDRKGTKGVEGRPPEARHGPLPAGGMTRNDDRTSGTAGRGRSRPRTAGVR